MLNYKENTMAIDINKGVFHGHKLLLGNKHVTFEDETLPLRFDLYQKAKDNFDWGHNGPASMQLAFSILYEVSDKETALSLAIRFTQEVVKKFDTRSWVLNSSDVLDWIKVTKEDFEIKPHLITQTRDKEKKTEFVVEKKGMTKLTLRKDNIVTRVCKELHVTEKELAAILEVDEEMINEWSNKNEIPNLAKKAIEYYNASIKNQKILDECKDFLHLLQAS